MGFFTMRLGRIGTVAALAGGLFLVPDTPLSAADKTPDPIQSLSGNYLAGQHAQRQRDMKRAAFYLNQALKQAPDEDALKRRSFILLVVEGRIEEAAKLADDLIRTNQHGVIASLVMAIRDIHNGNLKEAETRLNAIPKEGISSYITPALTGWALMGQRRQDAALAAMQSLADSKGARPLYDLHTALVKDLAGDEKAAEQGYLDVIKGQSGISLRVAQFLGDLYRRQGKPDKAMGVYTQYLKAHPQSRLLDHEISSLSSGANPGHKVATAAEGAAEALFGVASSLRQQNANETALVFIRLALHLRPEFPTAQILLADLLEMQGRLKDANEIYAAIKPGSPFWWSSQIRIAMNKDELGETKESIRILNALAEKEPEEWGPLVNLGDILRRHDRFEEAVVAYDKAVKRVGTVGPRQWSLLYARGIALERSKIWPRAEKDFLKALELRPDQPYVLNYLGYSWVEKGLNLKQAEDMIRKAVNLRPNDGYIVDSLGWVLYQLGRYQEAVKELERAVELRPEDPVINDHLGDAFWRVGRKIEARYQWDRALVMKPDNDLKKTIQKKLKNGLGKPKPIKGQKT